nr:sugar transferase [Thermoleophilaceae bacterium]
AMDRIREALGQPVGPFRADATRRRALAAADCFALTVSYVLLTLLSATDATTVSGLLLLAATLPLWVVLNKFIGLYDRDASVIHKSTLDEIPRLAHSVLLGAVLIWLITPVFTNFDIGRTEIFAFYCATAVLMPASRAIARVLLWQRMAPERCVILGSGEVAARVARKLRAHPEHGARVIGYIDAHEPGWALHEIPRLGEAEEIDAICREWEVERLIVAFSKHGHGVFLDAIRASKLLNVKITMVPRLFEVMGSAVEIDQLQGMTLLGLRGFQRTRSSLGLKRAIDVAGSAAMLLLLSPVLVLIAIAIKLDSRGPVLYAQRRIGRNNIPFKLYKFRTMDRGADELKSQLAHLNEVSAPMFKIADDPRMTRVGRFLRRTSLDELPQLWNVLSGRMSLVGPRPLIPSEDAAVVGRYRSRLDLTPGLTGPWQVMGRTAIPFSEMVELDYLYVADWSLWNDVKLMMRTMPVVLYRRGS